MFFMRLYWYLVGYCQITLRGKYNEKFLNGLLFKNIKFRGLQKIDEENMTFVVSKRRYNKRYFDDLLKNTHNISCEVKEVGVMSILSKYKKRSGLLVGAILGISMLMISTMFIWDVKIIQNEDINEEKVIELLDYLGCKVGAVKKSLDIVDIQNKYIIRDPEISWIAINLKGTVANVEIKKRKEPAKIIDKNTPVNIVAKKTGKIISMDVFQGTAVAIEGNTVKKGELLISGVIDSNSVGLRIKHATGKILAETYRKINIEIPLSGNEKVYTGNQKTKSKYKILGQSIAVGVDFSKQFELYDRHTEEGNIRIFDKIVLPILKNTEYYEEYILKEKKISIEKAKNIANDKLNDIIYMYSNKNIEIKSKSIEYDVADDKVILFCELECIEDIAEEVEFSSNLFAE